jgi:plasmid maintenance system antidote protein VapI
MIGAYLAESHTSKKELAEKLGCTPETLNNKLTGRTPLTIKDARNLATAIDKPIAEICAVAP